MSSKTRNNLTKKDISKTISLKTGLSVSFSNKFIEDTFAFIGDYLLINNKLNIKNFGLFTCALKKQRLGRNPKNKQSHIISERKVVKFKASDILKKKLNKNLIIKDEAN